MSPLTSEIVRHLCRKLGVIDTPVISLHSDGFLTNHRIAFKEDGKKDSIPVWGATIHQKELSLNLLSCSFAKDDCYVMIFANELPFYGIHLSDESDVFFSHDGKAWMNCPLHRQATLLASFELLGEELTYSESLSSTKDEFKSFLNLLEFS